MHAHICTHGGTSVQRTPSILNPDPGLHSVFTCKWSTTICGPSRLLCPSSRLGPGMRAASQMGGPHQMGSNAYGAKRREERKKREGRGCLPGSHRNSRDSHIGWKWSMVRSPSLTGEQRDQDRGLPVWNRDRRRSTLRESARYSHNRGDSRAYEEMAGNLVSSWWVEVSYLTSVYVDVEGWVSAIRN